MVVIVKEDVFNWFKELSGGKRIELMCGLINLCIPLECRFFATYLEHCIRKDYDSLKEAESKSNSVCEFEKLASLDWLQADMNYNYYHNHHHQQQQQQHNHSHGYEKNITTSNIINSNNNTSSNCNSSCNTNNSGNNISGGVGTTGGNIGGNNNAVITTISGNNINNSCNNSSNNICSNNHVNNIDKNLIHDLHINHHIDINNHGSMDRHLSSVRSKIVVYLCLLSSVNTACANIAYKAFKDQLSCENISNHFFGSQDYGKQNSGGVNTITPVIKKEPSTIAWNRLLSGENFSPLFLDAKFYSEIVLLHTLAIHHSAFTFEQQTKLSEQLQKVQQWMDAVMFATAAAANASSAKVQPTSVELASLTSKLSLKVKGASHNESVHQGLPLLTDFHTASHNSLHSSSSSSSSHIKYSSNTGGNNSGESSPLSTGVNNNTNNSSSHNNIGKTSTPPTVSPTCVRCYNVCYLCTCSSNSNPASNLSSLTNTPSTTPPPVISGVAGQALTNSLTGSSISLTGSVNGGQHIPMPPPAMVPPPLAIASQNPYWFYMTPPPPIPPAQILNGAVAQQPPNTYGPPNLANQTHEQIFQYYYAMAMAAAACTSTNAYGWPTNPANSLLSGFGTVTGLTGSSNTSLNSLAAAAASFQSTKTAQISCYNCGVYGHLGSECKETSFAEQQQQHSNSLRY